MTIEWLSELGEGLRYGFMQRALIAGMFVGGSCGVLGVFLVLRRFSMLGDGLAHFSFGAIGLALLLNLHPLGLAAALLVVAALIILRLSRRAVYGDAAIGMVSSVGLATGVLLASLGGGFNVDLFGYLFGDILAVTRGETIAAVGVSLAVLTVTAVLYRDLLAVSFDPDNARVLGVHPARVEIALLLAAAVTVALGIKVVGTLLVSSLIVFPAVTALQVARGFRTALLWSAAQAVVSVAFGVLAAYVFDLPAGATIVMVNLAIFLLTFGLARVLRL